MAKDTKAKGRSYKQSETYEDSPAQVKRRELRNKARRKLAKEGRVRKGQDVDHIHGVGKGNSDKNLRAISEHKNRSYKRKKNHRQDFSDRK